MPVRACVDRIAIFGLTNRHHHRRQSLLGPSARSANNLIYDSASRRKGGWRLELAHYLLGVVEIFTRRAASVQAMETGMIAIIYFSLAIRPP
jgi:hypothetical protein